MPKKLQLILLSVLLISALPIKISAQETKKWSYSGDIRGNGVGFERQFSFLTSHGVDYNDQLFLGLGLGYAYHYRQSGIPIYFSCKWYIALKNTKHKFMINLDSGVSVIPSRGGSQKYFYYGNGGFGMDWRIKNSGKSISTSLIAQTPMGEFMLYPAVMIMFNF